MVRKRNPAWWVFALIAFFCVFGAFAAGVSVYKITENHTDPVPGWSSPSTSRSK